MTVSDGPRKQPYTGTGANTALSTVFPFFEADDLEVQSRVTATGVVTVLTVGVHYSVTPPASPPGVGTVTPLNGATDFQSSVTWTIVRTTDREQQTDYVENDAFPAETHEAALDRLTLIAQELADDGARSLRFPSSDSSSLDAELPSSVDRASQFLAFDASGNPTVSPGVVPGSVAVSAFMQTVLDDASAAAARVTLGAQQDVITNRGDLVRGGLAGVEERLPVGTSGQVLRTNGADALWGVPTGLEVSNTPVSPLTATTVQAALNELNAQYSVTAMSGAQDNFGTAEVAITGLAGIAIPGGGDGVKKFQLGGQVTAVNGTGDADVKVYLGNAGTIGDTLIAHGRWVAIPSGFTLQIPRVVFTPASGNKITVSIQVNGAAGVDMVSAATDTFLIIKKFSNA